MGDLPKRRVARWLGRTFFWSEAALVFVLGVALWTIGKRGPDFIEGVGLLAYAVPTIALAVLAGYEFGRADSGRWVIAALVIPVPMLIVAPLLLLLGELDYDPDFRTPYRSRLVPPVLIVSVVLTFLHFAFVVGLVGRATLRAALRGRFWSWALLVLVLLTLGAAVVMYTLR